MIENYFPQTNVVEREIGMKKLSFTKKALRVLIAPEQYDFWLREFGSTEAWSRCYARVISRRQESARTFTLRLKPNRNFSEFLAGQHINIAALIEGRRVVRSYSFSNSPDDSGYVEITVRHDPNGKMSDWLYRNANQGAVIELGVVFGEMTFSSLALQDQPGVEHLVLIAAGSGITPMMSLLGELAEQGMPEKTSLLYWDRGEEDFCFESRLNRWVNIYKNFSVTRIATQPLAEISNDPSKVSGRISADQLARCIPSLDTTAVLACGGHDFVSTARSLLQSKAQSFYAESFSAPASVNTDESVFSVSVELSVSGRTLEVSNQLPLLEALEQQGVNVESGCRMGICNTCVCEKLKGTTRDTVTGETDDELGTNVRLCVSRAVSNISLNL